MCCKTSAEAEYLIGSHRHPTHSHRVHAHLTLHWSWHLALHLILHLARHLAHLGRAGTTDRAGSAKGVVHHHAPKLALVPLLRKLLLGIRAAGGMQRTAESGAVDTLPTLCIACNRFGGHVRLGNTILFQVALKTKYFALHVPPLRPTLHTVA